MTGDAATDDAEADDPARPSRGPRRVRVAPLAPVALALAAGIVADRFADPWSTRVWAAAAVAMAGLAAAGWRRPRWVAAWLALGFAAVGGAWHHHVWSDLAADDLARLMGEAPDRRPCWLRGNLDEPALFRPGESGGERPGARGSTRTVLAATGWCDGRDWHPASGRVQVWIEGDRSDLDAGQPVQVAGTLSAIEGPLNPGELDPRLLARARGIRLRVAVDGPDAIWRDPDGVEPALMRMLAKARAGAARTLAARIDPDVAPLAAALLLGRRESVDSEINDAFSRTGTTHLLAISGLHLQLLAVVLGYAVRLVGLGRRASFAIVAAGVLAYAVLVGPAPSVCRSAAMTLGLCLAGWCDRSSAHANPMAAALIATLAFNPAYLFDVGCQLSFLAVAAILWCWPEVASWAEPELSPLDKLERAREPWWRMLGRFGWVNVRAAVAISLVIWLAAWPLVALRFHLVAPIGVLINIPLIPLTSLALFLAGLTLASGVVWSPLAAGPAWACGQSLRLTEWIVRLGLAAPGGHGFGPGPAWPLVVVFYAALALAVAATTFRHRHRRAAWAVALAVGATLAAAPMIPTPPRRPEAEILAVGHGLATLVRSADGRSLLYDCGKMGDPHVGRRVIAPALWARGVQALDAVVLSHPDADHYNGLPDLLDRFAIAELRVPPGFAGPTNPGAALLLDQVRRRGIPIREVVAGDRIDLGGLHIEVLHPSRQARAESTDNARSVVLAVNPGDRCLLLTGDLERDGLADLMRQPMRPVPALLSPHHGGRTANPSSLFRWARPGLVAVSQRVPAAGTRDPLAPIAEAEHFPVLRTWDRGSIRFGWEPDGLSVRGFLDPPPGGRWFPDDIIPSPPWVPIMLIVLGLVAGFWLFAALAIVEWGAWALVLPGRLAARPGHSNPRGPAATPIELERPDGVRLVGDWYPSEGGQGRTLILLPGLAETRAAMADRAGAFVGRGWNVAALDHRAAGGSGGTRLSFGTREANDLRAWIDALAPRVGPSARFAAWGRSMGAGTALKAAVLDHRLGALVLEAAYHDLRHAAGRLLARLRIPAALAAPILIRARWLSGVPLDRPGAARAAPGVDAPVLILHGANDPLVPLDQARKLAGAFPTPAAVEVVAGAGHADVVERGGPPLFDRVAAFLDHALPEATP